MPSKPKQTKPRKKKSKPEPESQLSVAAAEADREIKRSSTWQLLGDIVEGTRSDFIVARERQSGAPVLGAPRVDQRLKAAEMLLQYRYGKPSSADPAQQKTPESDKGQSVSREDLIDKLVEEIERAKRMQKVGLLKPAEDIPDGEAEVIE